MNNITWLLASRYLLSSTYEKNISVIIIIALLSIIISTGALALVAAIMNGFEHETIKTFQGIHASAIIDGNGAPLDVNLIRTFLHKHVPEVIHSTPHTFRYGIIMHDQHMPTAMHVVSIMAIDPLSEIQTTALGSRILNHKSLQECLVNNQVIIASGIAQDCQLAEGDSINLLTSDEQNITQTKVSFETTSVHIGGIIKTGIDHFDHTLLIVSFDGMHKLFADIYPEQLSIALHKQTNEKVIIQKLKNDLDLNVYSWKELYPALISAMALEKYVSICVILLVAIIACMNVISILSILITSKRSDIALLYILGTSSRTIMSIFMSVGTAIVLIGTMIGLGLAWVMSICSNTFHWFPLPDAYYTSHLPIHLNMQITMMIFTIMICIGAIASWLPTRSIKHMNLAHILRFES